MISGIRGVVENKDMVTVEVDVGGVFYRLFVAKKLQSQLVIGQEKTFKTYMHVSENEMSLYGFEAKEEVDMFRMLLGVSGVGPKSGLLIFDENGVKAINKAIINADVDFFQAVKGLGKKTAQKIIIDLKTKVGSMKDLDLGSDESEVLTSDETYLSLIQLGFDKKSVAEICKKIPKNLETTQERLEWCLKSM